MKKLVLGLVAVSCAFLVFVGVNNAGDKGDKSKFKCVCPVSGKPAKKDHAVKYLGGEVYFCCPMCPGAFTKNTKKFAAKANHQLYGNKQAALKKCPFTGKALNPATKITVNGTPVCFCCFNCQGKAKKAKNQVQAIFNTKCFKKGFVVKKTD